MAGTSPDKSHPLLDHLMNTHQLKNDAALGRFLGVPAPSICKIRSRVMPISAEVIIKVHEVAEMPIRDIKFLIKQAEPAVAAPAESGGSE